MSAPVFTVPAPGKAALATLVGLCAVLPLGLIAGLLALDPSPPSRSDTTVLAVTVAGILLLTLALGLAMRRRAVRLDGGVLVVNSTFYTRRVPVADLDLDAARSLDLREHPELRPGLKLNGYALPGLAAGHFRSRDLKHPLFCLLTDPQRVLLLPERGGKRLLLSLDRPQALLDALRSAR